MSDHWQSRIVRHGEARPDDLLANPNNFRRHPRDQQEAMTAILEDVGWVSDIIVNETTGHVIDGHMRIELAMRQGEQTVPVTYVRLTPEEELKVLATFDPVSGMAFMDKAALRDVLADVALDDDRTDTLFARLAREAAAPADTDWLADYKDPEGRSASGSLMGPEEEPVFTSESDDVASMTFVVPVEHRQEILAALREARQTEGVLTSGEALVYLARAYMEGR